MSLRPHLLTWGALPLMACLTLACGGSSSPATSAPAPPSVTGVPVAVTIQRTNTGLRLENGFVGFSYEKSKLNSPLFDGANAGLVTLFKRLGPGVLRVGGNSVDKTTWDPTGPGLTPGKVASADVDRLAGFLKAANWQVIYAMNYATNTPAQMADEAAYAAKAFGTHLFGFEIGNEVDLYHSNGLRATTFTYADFLTEWRAYAAAIQAKVPGAVLTGPASAYNTAGFTVPFAKDEATGISLLTQHYYRANGQLATSTIDLLLTPDPALPTTLQALQKASATLPRGFRLAEANSFYNGGAPNVSDAFGTALWAIDFLFTNALNGSAGVNFHGGGNGTGYTPIADDGTHVVEARPEYYGLFIVSQAGPGALLPATVAANGLAVSAYAVAADSGSTNLVIVNKDRTQAASVTASLGASASTASLTTLSGPSLDSPTGILLNGAPIGADGSWAPASTSSQPVTGTTLKLLVAPASAVLVSLR
ncbi:hypothetical protein [Geothrix sp. PMB-07]|uniref:hypothetical protein n=1 Tax=Geothrix sp. PMB-07 TaxID=3068640 RepID=UPI002740C4DB|nr:hypothetical protein [Geothrix sp. PMB-07]WLT31901.1 hypothetical protein Q9293_00950 [Geothrix sp. PMB-07]